jgi:hypothetical protein
MQVVPVMKRSTQRNLRLLGYALLDIGAGVFLGLMLGLALEVYVLDYVARQGV